MTCNISMWIYTYSEIQVTAVHARACYDAQAGACLSSQSCACTCYDKQAGCVTFQLRLCMHVCAVMGSRQGA